jgi:hypothetical protein
MMCTLSIAVVAARAADLDEAAQAFRAGDFATALRLLSPLADQGDEGAQSLLGAMYLNGDAGQVDYARARHWLFRAAQQGDEAAENDLGMIYCKGLGVPRDCRKGLFWYGRAADQGDAVAALNVGLIYDLGEGVRENPSLAARWYRLAADKGDATAQYNLGLLYDSGRGVAQDSVTAVRLWTEAASHGEPDAQSSLGAAYASGHGEPHDLVQAYAWFSLAAIGYPDNDPTDRADAERNRDIVAAKLTAAEIREAQLEVGRWSPAEIAPPAPQTPSTAVLATEMPSPTPRSAVLPLTASASPPIPASPWWVQLGAYATEADAKAELREAAPLPAGLTGTVAAAVVGGHTWFRARVNGFALATPPLPSARTITRLR